MKKIDKGHPLSQSTDFVAENIETLKTLFPTIVKEGKIDIKELQALLGNDIETEEEYYRFTWAGKNMARREANKPSTATLRPDKESSKDWDTTQNIFIEGDNLEVLKLLQKSYANKIKMIYIDPPYNTGKDFVYKDNYNDNLGNYLAITGQVDEEGKRINTNSESDGRYHSNWLNMMYPRLKLARNLLTDDGVIFISIDDNEAHNLRFICNDIFGEENFIANIIWQKKYSPQNDAKWLSDNHDHILLYSKNKEIWRPILLPRTEEMNDRYTNPDNDPKGDWKLITLHAKSGNNSNFSYTFKNGKPWSPPPGTFARFSEETLSRYEEEGKIFFGKDGNSIPSVKNYLSEVKQGVTPLTIWMHNEAGHNHSAKEDIKYVFDGQSPFDTPKPVKLLKRILQISTAENDLVLDFFAGSATTAHALFSINADDHLNRKFICVQIPEAVRKDSEANKMGFRTISDISKERIKRAGEKILSEHQEDLFSKEGRSLDVGFRAFKLDSSNIRAWDGNPEALEDNLFNAGSNIKENRTEEDILYEILLKYGLDLTMPIEHKKIAGKQVFNIGMGALFICLGDKLTTEIAEGIGKWKEELKPATTKVIFKDTGFTDVEKTNSLQILKRYGILEVNTI